MNFGAKIQTLKRNLNPVLFQQECRDDKKIGKFGCRGGEIEECFAQWLVKLKIEDQEMCEIQAFDKLTRSLNDLSDPVLNLSLCFFVSLFI